MLPLPPDLCAALQAAAAPVILLEGTRRIPADEHAGLETVATRLFHEFPHAIAALDPARLQLVPPDAGEAPTPLPPARPLRLR